MQISEKNNANSSGFIQVNEENNNLITRGINFSRKGETDEALDCFLKASKINENYLILYNIGCLYYKKGEYKKSVFNLEKSRRINPSFSLSSLIAGLCYSRLDNTKAAQSNFINVLMIDPDNKTAATALSILLQNQGKIKESVKILSRLYESHKDDASIRKLKTDILFSLENIEETASAIKELKKDSPSYKSYDNFINSVPVEIYNDKYGTLSEKISSLEYEKTKKSLISLSLCHLLKGDTDSAIDYQMKARVAV
jgi:tetratricopeptide (TPR) repeat protein